MCMINRRFLATNQKSYSYYLEKYVIVLLKSLKNCKRCNKGNFTLKSNSS